MNELKTKSILAHWLLLAYFGHTLDVLWSASEYLLMRADESWRELMRAGDSQPLPPDNFARQLNAQR